jgi:hypothetical protein
VAVGSEDGGQVTTATDMAMVDVGGCTTRLSMPVAPTGGTGTTACTGYY